MAEFATLQDVKAHLNKTSTTDDGELGLMLDAAEDVVRSLVGSFAGVSVTERVRNNGGMVLLTGRPVDDVQLNGGAVSGFTVARAAGVLYDVPATYGPLTATYTVGGGVVPAAVTLATLVITAHLWETQRGSAPVGPLAAEDDSGLVPGLGFAVPNRARELLEPFIRSSSQIA